MEYTIKYTKIDLIIYNNKLYRYVKTIIWRYYY